MKKKQKHEFFSSLDVILLILVVFLSCFTRFFRIQFPEKCYEFEEIYGEYINDEYNNGRNDSRLQSLVYYLISYNLNYNGTIHFSKGKNYEDLHFITLRSISILFSCISTSLVFIILKIINVSNLCSLFMCSLIILNPKDIYYSRFINYDSILYFFHLLYMICSIFYIKMNTIGIFLLYSTSLGLCVSCDRSIYLFLVMFLITEYQQKNKKLLKVKIFLINAITIFICFMMSCSVSSKKNVLYYIYSLRVSTSRIYESLYLILSEIKRSITNQLLFLFMIMSLFHCKPKRSFVFIITGFVLFSLFEPNVFMHFIIFSVFSASLFINSITDYYKGFISTSLFLISLIEYILESPRVYFMEPKFSY